jgi:hypothetical protein
MKKPIIVLTIFAMLSILVACGKTTTPTQTTGSSDTLSGETELLVGTFKLEDTDLAVTLEQAKQLLPLWQTLQSLSTSSTSATEEIDALVEQIKGVMTTEQMDKITGMNLTQQDIMSVMNQAGVFPGGAQTTTTPMAMGGFPSGDMPGGFVVGGSGGGMPPSGGGSRPSSGGGGGMSTGGGGNFPAGGDPGRTGGFPGASTTPQPGRQNMGSRVPAPLLNALIQLLQEKVK